MPAQRSSNSQGHQQQRISEKQLQFREAYRDIKTK